MVARQQYPLLLARPTAFVILVFFILSNRVIRRGYLWLPIPLEPAMHAKAWTCTPWSHLHAHACACTPTHTHTHTLCDHSLPFFGLSTEQAFGELFPHVLQVHSSPGGVCSWSNLIQLNQRPSSQSLAFCTPSLRGRGLSDGSICLF